jgi:CRP/FNR family cyclic AMP-dependent transcriptional regulator
MATLARKPGSMLLSDRERVRILIWDGLGATARQPRPADNGGIQPFKEKNETMHRIRTIDQHLTNVALFSACSKAELQRLTSLFTTVKIPAGEVVTKEGRVGAEFVVIIEGKAAVSIGGSDVATLGPGDFFGEIALLDGGPRTATVTAATDLVGEVMSHREFDQMLHDVPGMARKLLVGLAARLRDTDTHLTH